MQQFFQAAVWHHIQCIRQARKISLDGDQMKTKFFLLGTVAVFALGFSFFRTSGYDDLRKETEMAVVETIDKGTLVAKIRGLGDIHVNGPCFEGSRGNDVFPPEGFGVSDCYNLTSDGRDYLDTRSFSDGVYVRVSNGSDSIFLGDGDDIIDIRGGFEVVIDAGSGFNVINFSGLDVPDIDLRVEGEDIILEGKRGSIRMRRQYPREGAPAPIQMMVFEGSSLNASEIYLKAIDGQASDGNDVLTGTPGDDVIYPGLGDDVISALEGDDAIFYEGGNDTIMGSFEGVGHDTLSFPFAFNEVQFREVDNRDLKVFTPFGSVTLQFQIFFPLGDERGNIEEFIFTDGIHSDEQVRSAASAGR